MLLLKQNPLLSRHFLYFLAIIQCAAFLAGCATVPAIKPVEVTPKTGFYHKIEKGETLWKVSKIYNVDIEELIKINRISDISKIEIGQLILIPKSSQVNSKSVTYPIEDFIWPLKGKVIAGFGSNVNGMINKGINIEPTVNKDVVAARSGSVVFYSQNFSGYGNTVILDHGDGLFTVYARNSLVFVKVGDTVKKGTSIATVGSAGRDKREYLHFEIRKGYIPQNPFHYLP